MQTQGTLYIVATPIGNLGDLSPRALQILQQVSLILAEDSRHSLRLLQHFAVKTSMLSLHEHNEVSRCELVLAKLQQGHDLALISDAGTPLISDPGYKLVAHLQEKGIKISPIPGPCAITAALSASGLPSNEFLFLGFLSAKASQRQKQLESVQQEVRTLVFYEAPHRILASIEAMAACFELHREVVLVKELTKKFEIVYRSNFNTLIDWLREEPVRQKGEFVVLVAGSQQEPIDDKHTQHVLQCLLAELPVKQAANLAAKITGEKKNKLYQQALQLQGEKKTSSCNVCHYHRNN